MDVRVRFSVGVRNERRKVRYGCLLHWASSRKRIDNWLRSMAHEMASQKEYYMVTFTDVAYIVGILQNQYPEAKNVWVRRAAQDMIAWHAQNPKPTKEQTDAQDARVEIMCKRGTWF